MKTCECPATRHILILDEEAQVTWNTSHFDSKWRSAGVLNHVTFWHCMKKHRSPATDHTWILNEEARPLCTRLVFILDTARHILILTEEMKKRRCSATCRSLLLDKKNRCSATHHFWWWTVYACTSLHFSAEWKNTECSATHLILMVVEELLAPCNM